MRTRDFSYHLPTDLIAQSPLEDRKASRLLHLSRQTGQCSHRVFSDLPKLLGPKDLLVVNNSKVIPARLFGHKATGGQVEILIERVLSRHVAVAHLRASKAPKPGSVIHVGEYEIVVHVRHQERLFELELCASVPWLEFLEQAGHMPLPPYIKREDTASDRTCYQTMFACHQGSVAAPTAGLHFTPELMTEIQNQGTQVAELTLHVGAGTFLPVQTDDISQHTMHHEVIEVTASLCEQVAATKANGGRVIAVGTTVVRALESAALSGTLAPMQGETNIFITPGFQFRVIDALVTNFHLPESTLLMLVSALANRAQIMHAYQEAITNRYRFFSYGDAMFIE